jgi:glycosyltransferase involved in cell wall biosynthesis
VLRCPAVRILVDYRPALRHRTGIGEYVHEMVAAVQAQLRSSDSLTLFSSSFRDRLDGTAVPGARAVDARIPVRLLNLLWHRLEWPPIEAIAGPFDIIQAAHPLLIPARGGVRAVLIADLDFLDHPERTRAEIRRDYPVLAPSHAVRADLVVTISDYTAGRIRERLNVPPERLAICRPGAPPWPSRPPTDAVGPILFIGTIEPRKNLPVLFRAYSHLLSRRPDLPPLQLAGRVTQQSSAILAELERLPDVHRRTQHLGYVSDEERRRLYRDASMLVLPSLHEGFGMTALEAMTVGVPVVASNRGALPEVIGAAGTLVEPDDDRGFADGMDSLLSDPARRLAHRAAGIARAEGFSWVSSAAILLRAYEAALQRRTRGGA